MKMQQRKEALNEEWAAKKLKIKMFKKVTYICY